MGRMVTRILSTVILAGCLATAAIGEEAKTPALIYSPWTKNCVNGLCFTGSSARTSVGCPSTATALAASLVGRTGDAKKILHITLQRPDNSGGAVRLMIDENLVGERPFARCFVNSCTAEYEAGAELIDQLKQELVAQGWTAANDSPLAVLCVEPPADFPSVRAIVHDIVASGVAWVSVTSFKGRDVVRICVTNGRTMPGDIRALARSLQSFGTGCKYPRRGVSQGEC